MGALCKIIMSPGCIYIYIYIYMCVCVCDRFDFRIVCPIFTKFGVSSLPLEATPTPIFLYPKFKNKDMADAKTSEIPM
jgi:hypothetical protein